ncbi:MAG: glycine cleavage system protein GcvH [Planctomycetota bacterium]
MALPSDLKYTDQHEWIRVDGEEGVVGITEFAQNQLGDMTFVELFDVGTEVAKGEEAAALESCKAAASVYSPVDGEITAVNEDLQDEPALVNTNPFTTGWIFRVKIADASQLDELMDAEAYQKLLDQQD